MQRTSGFTLIELVIVLVILGVLAAVAVPQLGGTADTADRTALRAQAKAITSANSTNVANCRLNPDGDGCIEISDGSCDNAGNVVEALFDDEFDTDSYSFSGGSCSPEDQDDPSFRFEISSTADGSITSNTCCLSAN